jgi:hypothetical protein
VNARRLSSWLLIGVAVLVVLGHVCALPVHVHAGAVTTHAEDHPEHGGDGAAHGGSCEALRASPYFNAPALIPMGFVLPVISGAETRLVHATLSPATTGSPPPLFLLHAALLI